MHLVLLTRFHSNHARSGFITRLAVEAAGLGHQLNVINPEDVTLHFTGTRQNEFPVRWNNLPFPEADLILPSARWDDTHTWQVAETLMAWQRPVMLHNRVPLGDSITMARLFARRSIPSPRTWVLTQPSQVGVLLPELSFPVIMRSRYGGQGRRLIVVQHSGEAYGYAVQLARSGQPFLIQDLPPPLGEDVRALVVGKRICCAVERKAPEGFVRPRESGNMSVTPTALSAAEETIIQSAAELYGAPFCSVSILRTPSGPMLLEVSRAPTLEEMEGGTGENLALQIVEELVRLAEKH